MFGRSVLIVGPDCDPRNYLSSEVDAERAYGTQANRVVRGHPLLWLTVVLLLQFPCIRILKICIIVYCCLCKDHEGALLALRLEGINTLTPALVHRIAFAFQHVISRLFHPWKGFLADCMPVPCLMVIQRLLLRYAQKLIRLPEAPGGGFFNKKGSFENLIP